MTARGEKKAETRTRLISVARCMFTARGYEAVTLRDLAREAGVSTGAWFGHFDGKAAIFEAAMGVAMDVPAFLERVAVECAGTPLSDDALTLRKHLIGGG